MGPSLKNRVVMGIPARYMSALRQAQVETYAEGRYYSTLYVIASRILPRLQELGYAKNLELDSMFAHEYRYVMEPMLARSRRPQDEQWTYKVKLPARMQPALEQYRRDVGAPSLSAAAVGLLGLGVSDSDADWTEVERPTMHIPEILVPAVVEWQQSTTRGDRAIALSTIILYQLSTALLEMGIEHDLSRIVRVRWRSSPSTERALEEPGRLKVAIPRMIISALERARAILSSDTPERRGLYATMLRLLQSRIGQPLPAVLQDASPVEVRTNKLKPQTAPTGPDVYVERFLRLCKEREARDRWHVSGGRCPASTVDDHLGRSVHGANAQRIAIDRGWHITDHVATKKRAATKARSEGRGRFNLPHATI